MVLFEDLAVVVLLAREGGELRGLHIELSRRTAHPDHLAPRGKLHEIGILGEYEGHFLAVDLLDIADGGTSAGIGRHGGEYDGLGG